ncbi:hypothetical protein A3K64_03495 [Candidatus Micrarchaeota archaeon RBG_16_36_9]|nr:MAG: hypothetical protein A3K64_03495 [Candidatus Micrarchaeota archaeon RBG_16_36_9]
MESVELLADKNSKAWDFALKIQKYIKEQKDFDLPLKEVLINRFRNGEIQMHVPENVRGKDIYFIHDSSKDPQDWWIELLLLKDLLLSASVKSISFVLPDMLYSRQDRKDRPHVPISTRALAQSISPHLKRIITMDLHAAQIQGFYPENIPLDNLYSFPSLVTYLKENNKLISDIKELVIVAPDAGGVARARALAQRLNSIYPVAFIYKMRLEAGKIDKMILLGDVVDKDVLIIDDLIDSGGTLCRAADLLKENGARNLFCYGTHAIFSNGTTSLVSCFNRIMISNTHYTENNTVEVIDMSPIFAEAIYRAEKGLSISKLFE